jgi:hypothetical protein
MYDSSSATPLWEYNQYGDYVASCALSQDGSRGVAGSWGQLDATFGDVVTVFDKSSSTPILQILDDIDEPGSIFSVDISEDGSFVTAGGKAVHARQMGNGGEVYALRIIDSLTHDVGIDVINSPGSFLQVGQAVTPQVVVKNYGTQTETFNTYCMIYDSLAQLLYGDSIQISNLSPGANQTVDFSISWNVPSYGSYRTTAFTGLTNDEFLLNDTLIKHSICYHDGAVTSIDYPFAELTLHYTKHPRVHIANNGSYAENIPVNCEIKDQYNTLVYTGSGQAYLNPLQTSTITLDPAWAPADIGAYDVYVYTLLSEDYDPSNDTALTLTNITTEIMYDDGILDVYGYVSSNFYDNTFAEKMIPCLAAPYYIPSARVYVSNEDPVIVSLNLDSLGLPGLGPAYHIAAPETLSASGTGWLVKNFAPPLEMNNTDPFWFVVQWLSTSPNSPYIGMDNVTPRDSLSYWYWTESSNPGWHLWIFYDFMMRVMTAPEPGISEHNTQAQLRFNMFMPNPNPFVRTTTLHFTIPEPGILELNTYDVTGRLVKSSCQNITCPGEYDIMWQDIDKQGLSISSGVYFLKACFNERSATQKIILLRH